MKKTTHSNFRVEVTPRDNDDRDACESIAQEIRRHVDGLPHGGARGVYILSDTNDICEFCGDPWTEDGDYNGGCCTKDVEAEDARHPETAHERQ